MRALIGRLGGIGHGVLTIFSRGVRKVMRHGRAAFRQPDELIRLVMSLPPSPRVLIIEPNSCHAEVTMGMAKYFRRLGYNCQILVSSEIGRENPFCRMPKGLATAHYLMYSILMRVVTSRFLALYDFALLSSSFDYRRKAPFLERYRLEHHPKNGILFMEHDFRNLTSANPRLLEAYEAKRLLVLTNYHRDEKLTEIAPCYFGDVKTREKSGHPVNILVPGSNAQDVGALIRAAKTLVDKGCVDFRLRIIGAPANESARKLAEALGIGDHVTLLGRVDFPTLFREVEHSDFLVGPQDVGGYLNRKTSGARQLSIGFLKPLILPDDLAAPWGFGDTTCIDFSAHEGLVGAMERALQLGDAEYGQLVGALRLVRANTEKDSLNRLGTLLSEFVSASDAGVS